MKKMSSITFFLILLLCGCKEEEVQTVDWYKQHNQERSAMLDKCQKEKERNHVEKKSPNCANASEAQGKIDYETFNNNLKSLTFDKN